MHAVIELVAFLVGGMKMFVVVTFLVFVEEISLLLVTGSAFWHSSLTVSIIHNYFAITVTTICTVNVVYEWIYSMKHDHRAAASTNLELGAQLSSGLNCWISLICILNLRAFALHTWIWSYLQPLSEHDKFSKQNYSPGIMYFWPTTRTECDDDSLVSFVC